MRRFVTFSLLHTRCRYVSGRATTNVEDTSSHRQRSDMDGLLADIDRLRSERGRSTRRPTVSASELSPLSSSSHASGEAKSFSRPPPSSSSSTASPSPTLPSPPFASSPSLSLYPSVDAALASSDIACTLQELESVLLRLATPETEAPTPTKTVHVASETISGDGLVSPSDESIGGGHRKGEETANAQRSDEEKHATTTGTEPLLRWSDPPLNVCEASVAPIRLTPQGPHAVLVELLDAPPTPAALLAALSDTLTKMERAGSSRPRDSAVLSVTLRMSDPSLPFFTPRQSELELAPLTRLEVLAAKERLLQRMRALADGGAVRFTAQLGASAFDTGAEVFFACDAHTTLPVEGDHAGRGGEAGAVGRVGFPSLADGVWPAPCAVSRMYTVLGKPPSYGAMALRLHTRPWSDWETLRATHPPSLTTRVAQQLSFAFRFGNTPSTPTPDSLQHTRHISCDVPTERDLLGAGKDVLVDHWLAYCARTHAALLTPDAAVASYASLLHTTAARHASAVCAALARMSRRALRPPPPDRLELPAATPDRWPALARAASADCVLVVPDGASAEAAHFAAAQRTSHGQTRAVLLTGGAPFAAVAAAASLWRCAAVVSSLGPSGRGAEVHVSASSTPRAECAATLSAAAVFLQSRGTPYIVSREGGVGDRLAASLAVTLCALAREVGMRRAEREAAAALGTRLPPFLLLDRYGAARLLGAMGRHAHGMAPTRAAPAATRLCLRGEALRPACLAECVGLRVLAALVNEGCRVLLDGDVADVGDVNTASLFALAMRPDTGGVLARVEDTIGVEALVANMEHMTRTFGVAERPSPLLRAMREARETFRTLSDATLAHAREVNAAKNT